MKAIRYSRYGGPDVLELEDVDMPVANDSEILVRVRAASVNAADDFLMTGTPYAIRAMSGLTRPKFTGLGTDVAGHVEAVGRNVTRFKPGDEVFGNAEGTFAEYVTVREDGVVLAKPANLTFEQAAAVPLAAITALQALRDKANVRPGHKVLVNGAGGGVGTFGVQIAKALGAAEVTAVCGPRNVETVRSTGADHVVDYTKEDFTRTDQRFDVVFDNAGTRTLRQFRRLLTPKGVLVGVGEANVGPWFNPVAGPLKKVLYSLVISQTMTPFLASMRRDDLAKLHDLLESGTVRPAIDRTYPLDDVLEAMRYFAKRHSRGKIVITV